MWCRLFAGVNRSKVRLMATVSVAALFLASAVLLVRPPSLARLNLPSPKRWQARLGALVGLFGVGASLTVLSVQTVISIAILLVVCVFRRRSRSEQRRCRTQSAQLAHALEILAGELRIGAHPAHAFATAGTETREGVGEALRAVAARASLGGDVVGGLVAIADSSAISDQWHRIAVCWQLAHQNGLPIGLLISATRRDIAERQRFTARLEADLAGARATAVTLAALPVMGVLLGQLVGAHPTEMLFGDGAGGWLLVAGVVLAGLGLLWSDRIVGQVHTKVQLT